MPSTNLRHAVSWVLFGNAGKQVLTFLIGVVLARLLTPADFGLLVTVNIFTGVLGFIATGGMGQALVRAKSITTSDGDTIFTIQLLTGIGVFLFFYAIAPWIAAQYQTPLIADILRLSAISFIIRPFSNLPSSLLQRDMRFKAKALLGFITLVASSITSIWLAVAGYGVWSLVWGGIAGAAATAVSHAIVARWQPRLNFRFHEIGAHARFGGLLTLNNLILYIRGQASNFMISLYLPASFLGLFNKADSLRGIPITIIGGSIYQVSFRAMAKVQDDLPEAQRLFIRAMQLGLLYATPVYLLLFFCALPLIQFLYGDKWIGAAAPLSILALGGPLMLIGNQSGAVVEAFNHLKKELLIQTWTLAIILVSQYAILNLSPTLENLAYSLLGIAVIHTARMFFLAIKILELDWATIKRALIPSIASNGILFIVCYAADQWMRDIKTEAPVWYLMAFALTSVAAYTITLRVLPYPENRAELNRWINKIIPQAK